MIQYLYDTVSGYDGTVILKASFSSEVMLLLDSIWQVWLKEPIPTFAIK